MRFFGNALRLAARILVDPLGGKESRTRRTEEEAEAHRVAEVKRRADEALAAEAKRREARRRANEFSHQRLQRLAEAKRRSGEAEAERQVAETAKVDATASKREGAPPPELSAQPRTKVNARSFLRCVEDGKLDEVKALLKAVPGLISVKENGRRGETALHKAVGKGNVEMVKLLLANGADVNTKDANDQSFLFDGFRDFREGMKLLDILARLGREDVLAKVAIGSSENFNEWGHTIAQKALERISSPCYLSKIAAEAKQKWVRQAAGRRTLFKGGSLSDIGLLLNLAWVDTESVSENRALRQIIDQGDPQGLYTIATNSKHWGLSVSEEATNKIHDQELLAKVATEGPSWWIRRLAVERVRDQSALRRIATSDGDWRVVEAAAKKVVDHSLLTVLAEKNEQWQVRVAAIANIADFATLRRIVESDPDGTVCEAAVRRLEGLGERNIPQYQKPENETERLLMHLPILAADSLSTPGYAIVESIDRTKRITLAEAAMILTDSGYKPSHYEFEAEFLPRSLKAFSEREDKIFFVTGIFRVGKEEFVKFWYSGDNNW